MPIRLFARSFIFISSTVISFLHSRFFLQTFFLNCAPFPQSHRLLCSCRSCIEHGDCLSSSFRGRRRRHCSRRRLFCRRHSSSMPRFAQYFVPVLNFSFTFRPEHCAYAYMKRFAFQPFSILCNASVVYFYFVFAQYSWETSSWSFVIIVRWWCSVVALLCDAPIFLFLLFGWIS